MFKYILAGVSTLILAVLGFAALQPDTFRIERKTVIAVAPERVFSQVNDFRAWQAWSPWEKMDPAMQRDYGAVTAGVGASYGWQGNDKVGRGRMTIAEAVPAQKIVIRLDFLAPFEAHNTAEFTFTPSAGGTEVAWVMHGPNSFIGKVMGLVFDVDAMVGKDFEAGLANLKAVSEQQP